MRMKKFLILNLVFLILTNGAFANDCPRNISDIYYKPRTGVTIQNDNAIFDSNEPLTIPLTVDLADRLNIQPNTELDTPIGLVTIYKNGRILYDGKDITEE
jgi:hypothetical protein